MKVIRSIGELSKINTPIYWAIGFFDGLHLGHQAVIATAIQRARSCGALSGILTFNPHPQALLHPESAPRLLFSNLQEKLEYFEDLGVNLTFTMPFTQDLAAASASEFLDLLEQACPVAGIAVGEDWKFGQGRSGDIDFLAARANRDGFELTPVPPFSIDGERVSSTIIRHMIKHGELERAASMLGRPYRLTGVVIHGRKLAHRLGFPTGNIRPSRHQLLPPLGVYATLTQIAHNNARLPGICNLGIRPTVEHEDPGEILLENYLFDWSGDLYNQEMSIDLIQFLRSEQKFDSLDDLARQMAADCQQARQILSHEG